MSTWWEVSVPRVMVASLKYGISLGQRASGLRLSAYLTSTSLRVTAVCRRLNEGVRMIGLPLCALAKSPKTLEYKDTMTYRNVGHRIKRHSGTAKRGATLLHVTPGTSASTET